jgi:hypothetical protein
LFSSVLQGGIVMPPISFEQLVDRYGEISAWYLLAEIEKAAGIQPKHENTDPEARLTFACRLQDAQAALVQVRAVSITAGAAC